MLFLTKNNYDEMQAMMLCDCIRCAINKALENNNLKHLKRVLSKESTIDDINMRGTCNMTPLMYAIDVGCNDDIILCLLENGADPSICFDTDEDSILTTMFYSVRASVVHTRIGDNVYKLMFEKGANPNYLEGYFGRLYGGPIGFGLRHGSISPKVLSYSLQYGLSYSTHKEFLELNTTCEMFFKLFCYLVCQQTRYRTRSKVKLPPEFTRVLASFLLF